MKNTYIDKTIVDITLADFLENYGGYLKGKQQEDKRVAGQPFKTRYENYSYSAGGLQVEVSKRDRF